MLDPLTGTLLLAAGKHGPLMLMYHSVQATRTRPEWPWAVSIDDFRSHLDMLRSAGWQAPTMRQFLATPERFSKRTAVITFDDGYADNLAPMEMLRERDMSATCFVVSGSIGAAPKWPANGRPSGRILDAAEIRQLSNAGIEIGSHTVNHLRLTELDPGRRRIELAHSKDQLENILGQSVTSFAYPYGAYDDACEAEVAAAGYVGACTTRTGMAIRDRSPFALRRLTISNTDTAGALARKLFFMSNDGSWPQVGHYFRKRLSLRLGGKGNR